MGRFQGNRDTCHTQCRQNEDESIVCAMNKCLCVTMIAQYIEAKQAGHRQHPNQVNSLFSLFLTWLYSSLSLSSSLSSSSPSSLSFPLLLPLFRTWHTNPGLSILPIIPMSLALVRTSLDEASKMTGRVIGWN